jgi:hypothetical protein
MPMRSVEDYKARGLALTLDEGHRFVADTVVDAMIAIGGPLPGRPITFSATNDAGEFVDRQITGREALVLFIERAARGFYFESKEQVRPTARQLVGEFEAVALAALKLLDQLKAGAARDINDRPSSQKFGELVPLATEEDETAGPGRSDAIAGGILDHNGRELLQDAVRGVVSLARWAEAAVEHKEPTAEARPIEQRNENDEALDAFVGRVVTDCWHLVCGREIVEGPKLCSFVQRALLGVNVMHSEDSVRERIRRALGRRGKTKSKRPF